MPIKDDTPPFHVGDIVEKVGGDYYFDGEVMAIFSKKSGELRVVVENEHGVLHIYNIAQLRHKMVGFNPNPVRDLLKLARDAVKDGSTDKALLYIDTLADLVK